MEQTAERRVERINTILFGMMLGIVRAMLLLFKE